MDEKNLFKTENVGNSEEKKAIFTIEFESNEIETLIQGGEIEKIENVSGAAAFKVGDIFHVDSSDSKYEVKVISAEETADSDEKLIKYRLVERSDE